MDMFEKVFRSGVDRMSRLVFGGLVAMVMLFMVVTFPGRLQNLNAEKDLSAQAFYQTGMSECMKGKTEPDRFSCIAQIALLAPSLGVDRDRVIAEAKKAGHLASHIR